MLGVLLEPGGVLGDEVPVDDQAGVGVLGLDQQLARRQQQSLSWMWERIDAGLKQAFRQDPQVRERLPGLLTEVARGEVAASTAARSLLALAAKGGER